MQNKDNRPAVPARKMPVETVTGLASHKLVFSALYLRLPLMMCDQKSALSAGTEPRQEMRTE